MAATFNNALVNGVGTVQSVLYTSETLKTILVGCCVTNITRATLPVTVAIRRGDALTRIANNIRVPNGESFEAVKGNKIVLLPGDELIAYSADDNAFDIVVSLLEGVK